MPSPLIHRATEADVPTMVALRREAEAWLFQRPAARASLPASRRGEAA